MGVVWELSFGLDPAEPVEAAGVRPMREVQEDVESLTDAAEILDSLRRL